LVYISNIKNKVEVLIICLLVYFKKCLIHCCYIRGMKNKVPNLHGFPKCLLLLVTTANMVAFKTIILFIVLFVIQPQKFNCYSAEQKKDNTKLVFLMFYETNKPLEIKRVVLHYSQNKWLNQKNDSLVMNSDKNQGMPDSIIYNANLTNPLYITIQIYTTDKMLKSNTFYASSENVIFDVTVGDISLKIRSKTTDNSLSSQNSIQGLALIILAILEMIIAYFISKTFGLPRQVILMVLAANIAAFPIYLLHLPSLFTGEILIFATKAIVMIIIGMRKMPKYQILLLLFVLTLISLGFKELFFFIARII